MTEEPAQLQQTDFIDPARIAALNVVLGLPDVNPRPFCHQVFFWDPHPAGALGRDGHPKVGGIIPDFGLPRRMWAGGRLRFYGSLMPGREATKITKLILAETKQGGSGKLALVTLGHEIVQDGMLMIEDQQDLIYREEPDHTKAQASRPPIPAPEGEEVRERRQFSTTELFRYSALTLNGHRIHYDRDYARDIEGYPGLVVHGPLLAQYLMLMAEQELGLMQRFEFRARAPLFDFEEAVLCAKPAKTGLDLWIKASDGRLIMTALAQ